MTTEKTMNTEKQFKLAIFHDECPDSPREWDNLGSIYSEHRKFDLKDKDASDIREDDGSFPKNFIVLPVYMYEHGNVALNTTGFSCPWDSGQLGYIYVSKNTVRKEYGKKRISKKLLQKVENRLKAEIETLSQYLSGDVYGFRLIEKETGEVLDSCFGFYGSDYRTNGILDHISKEDLEKTDLPEVGEFSFR